VKIHPPRLASDCGGEAIAIQEQLRVIPQTNCQEQCSVAGVDKGFEAAGTISRGSGRRFWICNQGTGDRAPSHLPLQTDSSLFREIRTFDVLEKINTVPD